MATTTRGAIILAALGALLAACGGGTGSEKIVAKAGDIVITLADFQYAYTQISADARPDISTLEGKRSFASDIVNQRILLREGERITGPDMDAVRQQVEATRDQKMLEVLYREEVEEKTEVLGADVKEMYERRKTNIRAQHILLEDVEEAQRVREEIVAGNITFEDAAEKHSLDQSTRRNGGKLADIRWSTTVPEFQSVAFELEPGVISEPVSTNFGVHLIRVMERVPVEMGTFEEMRVSLRPDVRRDREVARMEEYVASVEEKAGLTWNDEAIHLLLDAMDEFETMDIDTIPTEQRYLPQLTPAQMGMTVATFNGRNWTLGDYMQWLASRPPASRPLGRVPFVGMKHMIRTAPIQTALLLEEARSLGYAERPEVENAVRRLRESFTIEVVHARFLQQADVPIEEVRAIYDSTAAADPDAYMIPDRVEMLIIIQDDEEKIRTALRRLAAGEDELQVINETSLDPRTRSKGGNTGLFARGTFAPKIEEFVFDPSLVGKGWQGPVQASNGVAAVKVLDYQESRRARFDEVSAEMTRIIANNRGELAFEEWLQEQRDLRGVEIFDDVLELHGQPIS